ncbi:MAG: hypothetical protein C0458_10550 [Methylobacterium sp.]|nr:hypothetical protein [Methylobacterium sp.]
MKVNFNKPIPSPEDISPELRDLQRRHSALIVEQRSIEDECRQIAQEQASARFADDRKTQVDALIRGSAYEPPADVRERLSALAKRRELVKDALHELSCLIRAERLTASGLVAREFRPEQQALARECFEHLAKAVAAHAKLGEIRHRLEVAGFDSGGLHDFGSDLFGTPGKRNDHASYALRDGVRRGYIAERDVPEGYL